MLSKIKDLSEYCEKDLEKEKLISQVFKDFYEEVNYLSDLSCEKLDIDEIKSLKYKCEEPAKYCPECGKKYFAGDNVCHDCLVRLKDISDKIEVSDIDFNPSFTFGGDNNYDTYDAIFTGDNLLKLSNFDFTYSDYLKILHDIKAQAFKNFDEIVKLNKIDFDSLEILDKVLLFVKSFVKTEFKSEGGQLGYFDGYTIYIDDRQSRSLQITTLIHELSHFLIQEILTFTVCSILNTSKNEYIESAVMFILSYSPFTQLIDEYSAHNVEGRFTLFGFQDYSSFKQIEKSLDGEMSREDIDITKSIGNTFAISIKEIMESLIDKELREEIKDQFLKDTLDRPDYMALEMENCQKLNDEGFMKAIGVILNEGFEVAALNIDKLSLNQ